MTPYSDGAPTRRELALDAAIRQREERERLINALEEAYEFLEGYEDADCPAPGDGFVPNDAMRVRMMIEEVLDRAKRYGSE
jgi:hypothetical protein